MSKRPIALTAGEHQPNPGDRDPGPPDRTVLDAVLAALGRPPGLYGVSVRPLWENHYRVNVLVGGDPTTVRIAHSFFIEADAAGAIRSATPRIARSYP